MARAITSSKSSKVVTGARGPNGSSRMMRIPSCTRSNTVGSKKKPRLKPAGRLPPQTTRAPSATVSATIFSMNSRRRLLMSGPISVDGSRPLPIFIFESAPAKVSTKTFSCFLWTKKRVGETQTWPLLRALPWAERSAAFSGSTSSWTITGAWPPSSMLIRFTVSAARRMNH